MLAPFYDKSSKTHNFQTEKLPSREKAEYGGEVFADGLFGQFRAQGVYFPHSAYIWDSNFLDWKLHFLVRHKVERRKQAASKAFASALQGL